MSERRRQATVVGFALLGAGGLMLLHNSSSAARPPAPRPTPAPTPLPPAPMPGPSGGVPPAPRPVVPRPAPRPAVGVVVPRPTWYLVKNLNGSIRLRTSNRGAAVAAAVATRVAGITVWVEGGQLVYIVPGAIAKRSTAYVPPKVSVYSGQATISRSGRSL